MTRRFSETTIVASAIALALAALLLAPSLSAQEEGDAQIVIGIYQPQQIAQATGLQQQMMEQMQGLQQRAQQAQQEGDQAAMQQIQMEAQQIQQDATNEFIERLRAVLPGVAEAAGAQIIASDIGYAAPGVVTEDVTQAVIDAMNAAESAGEEGSMEGATEGSMEGSSEDASESAEDDG